MNHRYIQRTLRSALALGSVLMASTAWAQVDTAKPADVLELTLDEAVRRAIEHNPDLVITRLGTEVEAARVGQSRGAFAPVFSTVLGRSSTATPPSNSL